MSAQKSAQNAQARFTIFAPVAGTICPLEQVPDQAFAEKLVGDGVAIDPVDQVLKAPIDGEVLQMYNTGHAITLKHESGAEILLHIGIDTVMLKGEGFQPLVKVGDQVRVGDDLIRFDADFIARSAKSLMTEIILPFNDLLGDIIQPAPGNIEAGQPLLEVNLGGAGNRSENTGEWSQSAEIRIPNPAGLHARPTASLNQLARQFQSDIEIEAAGQRGNARSLTAILNLNIRLGDTVTVWARGEDSAQALEKLTTELRAGLGEEGVHADASAPAQAQSFDDEPSLLFPPADDPNLMKGTCASDGLSFGRLFQVKAESYEFPEMAPAGRNEITLLDQCIHDARLQLKDLESKLIQDGQPERAKIFVAHQELLGDPELYDAARNDIHKGKSAAFAWHASFNAQANQLKKLNNPLLAERASDLQDVGNRVLRLVLGIAESEHELPENTILIAEDLTPSDTAKLDRSKVVGFCTTGGGASSHTAILARAMNLPALAGVDSRVLDLPNGTDAILNADRGELVIAPGAEALEQAKAKQQQIEARRAENLSHTMEPAILKDGIKIDVVANAGSVKEVKKGVPQGAEGVGLLRSEFLFLQSASAPDEEEQYQTYSQALKALNPGQPLIVRTLDVGGDKPLPYLPMPAEDNPFLGQRGIRIGLDKPGLLRQQLRAILRAAEHGAIHVMFPMIASLNELRMAKQVLEEERQALNAPQIPVGIMIEVPSAAMMADLLAPEVDFFSVGTNDLTQYTLAMDRGHPKMAPLADALHPAVLRMISLTCEAANANGKWVGVCGGLAGDIPAVPLLIGLGVKELSCSIPVIADVKARVRELDMAYCRNLAEQALNLATATDVREFLSKSN